MLLPAHAAGGLPTDHQQGAAHACCCLHAGPCAVSAAASCSRCNKAACRESSSLSPCTSACADSSCCCAAACRASCGAALVPGWLPAAAPVQPSAAAFASAALAHCRNLLGRLAQQQLPLPQPAALRQGSHGWPTACSTCSCSSSCSCCCACNNCCRVCSYCSLPYAMPEELRPERPSSALSHVLRCAAALAAAAAAPLLLDGPLAVRSVTSSQVRLPHEAAPPLPCSCCYWCCRSLSSAAASWSRSDHTSITCCCRVASEACLDKPGRTSSVGRPAGWG